MRLHDLKPPKGAVKSRKRVGRGRSSGSGKTSGRGQKGAGARSGFGGKVGFEGGQMPLQRRLPKVGFHNPFRKEFACINVSDLNKFDDGTEITPESLLESGLVRKIKSGIKVLGGGDLEKKLIVSAHKISRGAREKIEARGGEVREVSLGE